MDKGWYGLEVALRSKARYTGSTIIKINPAYTSQTCSNCQAVDAKSRESQALFVCTTCTHREHADINAAKTIRYKAAGLVVSGRSFDPQGPAKRQAPRSTAAAHARRELPRERHGTPRPSRWGAGQEK
nr:transposase [Nonomuraea africana]